MSEAPRPLLTEEEQRQKEDRLAALMQCFREGACVLLVGAGASEAVGFCSWTALIRRLEDAAELWNPGFVRDPHVFEADSERRTLYIGELKNHIRVTYADLTPYFELLYELFGRPNPPLSPLHEALAHLPVRSFATTNFDGTLERALLAAWRMDSDICVDARNPSRRALGDYMYELVTRGEVRRVLHLHGTYRHPHGIVLGADDYREAYGRFSRLPRDNSGPHDGEIGDVLVGLMSSYRFLFVGYSLSDPDWNQVMAVAARNTGHLGTLRHFAILPISEDNGALARAKARELLIEQGVGAIFYEQDGDDHSALLPLLQELSDRPRSIVSRVNELMMDGLVHEA